jgi:3-oxoadipate enol-lactonase
MPYLRTRLGRWYYQERGEPKKKGDPTMLLLPSLLFDGRMWAAQVEPLSALGRVVIVDGPGHGKSEAPPKFSLEEHADALYDALAELGAERAILIGLSWGGMTSMRFALQHPEKLVAMALLDTDAGRQDRAEALRYRAFISFARRFGVPRRLVERELAPKFYAPQTLRDRPELVDALTRQVNGYEREGLARACKAVVVHRTSIVDKLGAIKVPTLVICGREDSATTPDKSERIAAGIPGAKLVMVDGAGHLSCVERPAQVNEELVRFVRSILTG